jgi:hypothetical protein
MLSFARSLAVVMSQNQMIYKLGEGGPVFKALGGGAHAGHRQSRLGAGHPDLVFALS